MSEEKENVGNERSTAKSKKNPIEKNLKRRKANKTPSSPKKLSKKNKNSMSMMEPASFFGKLKVESSKIYESYIRPFLVNHPIATLIIILSIVTYLMFFSATYEEPSKQKYQEFGVVTDRVRTFIFWWSSFIVLTEIF